MNKKKKKKEEEQQKEKVIDYQEISLIKEKKKQVREIERRS